MRTIGADLVKKTTVFGLNKGQQAYCIWWFIHSTLAGLVCNVW